MYWDGTRWIDENAPARTAARPRGGRPRRPRLMSVMTVLAVALGVSGATLPGLIAPSQVSVASTGDTGTGQLYQENSPHVLATGGWRLVSGRAYSGGSALTAVRRGARLEMRFSGSAITLIGPKAPWLGSARIQVDGRDWATVDEQGRVLDSPRSLLTIAGLDDGAHMLAVIALFDHGRPFTVDAFRVTGASAVAPATPGSAQGAASAPIPTGTPAAGLIPGQTPGPSVGPGTATEPTAAPPTGVPPSVAPPTAAPPTGVPPSVAPPTAAPPTGVPPTAVPTPTPPAPPTPVPSVGPTPAPTAVPTPTPSGPAGIRVPDSIDSSGGSDVTAALNTWIASVPDNSTIVFRAGGVYKVSQGVQIARRHGLVFEGNGATIITTGSGSDQLASPFVIGHAYRGAWTGGNTDITVRNLTLVGNDPTPGTFGGGEQQAGMEIEGVSGLTVSNVTVRAVYGDGFKIGDGSTNVTITGSRVASAGRNGVAVISGSRITVRNTAFDTIGYVVFDVEPNTSSEASDTLLFTNNTVGTWGAEFFSVDGSHTGASISNVTVSGNSIRSKSLLSYVDNGNTARNRSISFVDNTSAVAANGPVLNFSYVDGLTVTGNVQTVLSGSLASFTSCTKVVFK